MNKKHLTDDELMDIFLNETDDELMDIFLNETEKRLKAQKHRAAVRHKNNTRKCKSCVFYNDGECLSNPERPDPRPMDTACELHRKRK